MLPKTNSDTSPRSPSTVNRRRRRTAFTTVEIIVAATLMAMVAAYIAHTFIFASKAEQATNKKVLAARTLQYIQGRIRRDAKWARKVNLIAGNGAPGGFGYAFEFSDLEGNKRKYSWDPATKKLKLPELTNPTTQVEYGQSKFRTVLFYSTEGGAEGVRVILSPLPMDEKEEYGGGQAQLWGAAMVGRSELDPISVKNRYKLFNEPAFPGP